MTIPKVKKDYLVLSRLKVVMRSLILSNVRGQVSRNFDVVLHCLHCLGLLRKEVTIDHHLLCLWSHLRNHPVQLFPLVIPYYVGLSVILYHYLHRLLNLGQCTQEVIDCQFIVLTFISVGLKVRNAERSRHQVHDDLDGLVPHLDVGTDHDDVLELEDSVSG